MDFVGTSPENKKEETKKMNKTYEIRRCAECGAMIEVLKDCTCSGCCGFSCCGKPMELLKENTSDGAVEKHVPVIEAKGNGVLVKVGEIAHPMIEEHYIAWIEVTSGSVVMRRQLNPGEPPEAFFEIPYSDKLVAREYCNTHGLWKK